ncbi:MAG: symmetrical bis(5'-nucleosyl)-tetraphosphatase [Enterobacterales bacterium]|nr:symmetrical bis(5'-nucleosyl)-tetraphosphatase [Enterobacterales bacterium]
MATYLIGDIQGCYQSFRKLLKAFQFDPEQDTLYLAGDLINRGPESLATMDFVLSHQTSIKAVLGNHDLHFLAVANETRASNPKDTFNDILNSQNKSDIINWLQEQPLALYFNDPQCFLSHAGLPPFWSVPRALSYAEEVSQIIKSDHADHFYGSMYGNEPRFWHEQLIGNQRRRCITNILTRMRYLDSQQGLEFNCKSPVGEQPEGLLAWFDLKNHDYQSKIAFGHWAALQGSTPRQELIALDTGCVWGGRLSAYRLQDSRFFRVNAAE